MSHETSVVHGVDDSLPEVRKITVEDLRDALLKGLDDFKEMPTHLFFVAGIYPLVMLIVVRAYAGGELLPLVFPILAGYTLFGPFVATGMYELSRRREEGLNTSRRNLFRLLRYHSIGSIAWLAVVLMVFYFAWLVAANTIYTMVFGSSFPSSFSDLANQVFLTSEGWSLIVIGCTVGLVFAVVVFTLSVVSFPMLIDKKVSGMEALQTSIRAVMANPGTMMVWGIVVVMSLIIGAIPLLLGLAVVLPVLGHATYHLYRKVVVVD